MSTHQLVDIANRGAGLTLTTDELAQRWGLPNEQRDVRLSAT